MYSHFVPGHYNGSFQAADAPPGYDHFQTGQPQQQMPQMQMQNPQQTYGTQQYPDNYSSPAGLQNSVLLSGQQVSSKNYDFQSAILYYNPDCKFSQQFLTLLRKYPLLQNRIQLHNVRQSTPPPFIRSVPTVLENNMHTFAGGKAFQWLEKNAKKSWMDSGSFGDTNIGGKGQSGGNNVEFSFINNNQNNAYTTTTHTSLPNQSAPGMTIQQNQMAAAQGKPPQQFQPPPGMVPVLPPQLQSQNVNSVNNKLNEHHTAQITSQLRNMRDQDCHIAPPQFEPQRQY